MLNEQAVKEFKLGTPLDAIGQTLTERYDSAEFQIIGVVKDYYHELFSQHLQPLGLRFKPTECSLLQISYTGDFETAKKSVEKAWITVNPGLKAEVKDFKAEMGEMYEIIFGTLVKILAFVSMLAIIISCLGLLGMATYTIQTRKKEIAIRKILGSSNKSLVFILSRGYLTILVISIMVSVPAAYFMNTLWLEMFAVHVKFDILTISTGVLILSIFGLLTIGSQTFQAAFINPVDNLKDQ